MPTTRISPNICAFPSDEDPAHLHIEIELPGVRKEDVNFKIVEDAFFVKAVKGDVEYVGTYTMCCPVNPQQAKASYKEGLLTVDVPYKEEFAEATTVAIE